jgi:hypothetical protein
MALPVQVNPSLSSTTPTAQSQSAGSGPLSAADGDPFGLQQLQYPLSGIGQEVPNYVVFYINLPTASKYVTSANKVAGAKSASTQNYDTLLSQGGTYQPVANNQAIGSSALLNGAVTALTKSPAAGISSLAPTAIGSAVTETLNLRPRLSRIKQTVALYMPDTLATTYEHDYSGIDATTAYGDAARFAALAGSVQQIGDTIKDIIGTGQRVITNAPNKQFNKAASAELVSRAAEDANAGVVGPGFTDLQMKSMGRAINPHAEMVFKATKNRGYNFVFDLVPRSQAEAIAIQNIIKTFKLYAAPEVTSENAGRYYIPPALFDIKFYFQSQENPTIARVSTCALTSLNVNYNGGNQFATFNDGSPIFINITLSFTEVDIITRQLIDQFGY